MLPWPLLAREKALVSRASPRILQPVAGSLPHFSKRRLRAKAVIGN
jgi:hypothetical protein